MTPFHVVNPRRKEGGGQFTAIEEIAAGKATIEWILHQPDEVGAYVEIPEGRRVTVAVHGEARVAVSDHRAEWHDAVDGTGVPIRSGTHHVAGGHKFIRPESATIRANDPAKSLLPGARLNPTTQPVRVELTVE